MVTFRRTATELGLTYGALDFEAAFTIDIRGRQGDRSVRPHFQTVRVRAVVSTAEPLERLAAVIEETEARCPVLNLLLDAKVNLHMEWLRDADGSREPVPRPAATTWTSHRRASIRAAGTSAQLSAECPVPSTAKLAVTRAAMSAH
jgi:hypothetical protein